MFFILSKLLWFLVSPANLTTMALVAGCGLLLDHDIFRSNRSKDMNAIDSSRRQHDVVRKPVPTFRHHALAGRRRWGTYLVVAATLAVLICGALPSGTILLRVLEDRFPPPTLGETGPSGIIVLGGAVDQVIGAARGQPTIVDAATRITEAVVLARRYPGARLVYSGGSNAIVATIGGEAEDARRLWVAMGVDPARITIEDRSRNTYENAQFSRDMLRPRPGESWLLVTSAYHMPRSVGLFRAAGFPVVPVPVDYRTTGTWRDFEPERDVAVGFSRFDFALREWIGLVSYRLSGKIESVFPSP